MQQPVNIYQPVKVRTRPRPPASVSSRRYAPRSLNQLASGLLPSNHTSNAVPEFPKSNLPHITCAILACVTTGGTMYGFSLYGNALKHSLHLTQSELAAVSSASFLAGLLSWGPGLVVDRFGERCSLIAGGLCGASSLFLFWLVATKWILIPRPRLVATLSTLGVLTCLAVSLVTGSVFKLVVSTCSPATKGAAVGAAKGYGGLGAGAYAILFEALGRKSDLDCLLMIGCFNVLASVVPALLLLPRNPTAEPRVDDLAEPHFRTMYLGLTGLGVLVVGQSVISLYLDSTEKEDPDYIQFILLALVWMGPIWSLMIHPRNASTAKALLFADEEKLLLVEPPQNNQKSFQLELVPTTGNSPVSDQYQDANKKTDAITTEADAAIASAMATINAAAAAAAANAPEQQPRQFNLFEMLSTVEAWLLCWTCTLLTGGGTLMTNNMGQMAESKQLHESVTPAALALFCAAQALSRVVTGALSDRCLSGRGWPRPVFLLFASAACALSHAVLALASREASFVAGAALSGVAFGMVWPLVVLIVGDLFGTKHLGANYMFYDGFDGAVGTLLISNCVAEAVYDANIQKSGTAEDDTTCYGDGCYQTTHFIVAGLAGSCILTSLCLINTKQAKIAYAVPSQTMKKA